MSATVIIEGTAARATRDRIFDCPYCNTKFVGHSADSGFTLATFAEMTQLGISAKCTCPTCNNTAVSTIGSASEIATVQAIAVATRPAKTLYKPGDTFDATGMVIVAQWSNGTVTPIPADSYTLSPTAATPLTLDDKKITVTHTASSKTVDVSIRVVNSEILKPKLLKSTYVYTGNAIAVQVSGYDSATMTRSNYSKTAVGTYKASYEPKTGYCWEDGTTTAVELDWEIVKAVPAAPTISPSTLSLTAIATPGEIAVTRDGNGAVSAKSSNTDVCTVSVSGTTVTVTAVADGTATVEISVAAGTNYEAAATKPTCAVTVALAEGDYDGRAE